MSKRRPALQKAGAGSYGDGRNGSQARWPCLTLGTDHCTCSRRSDGSCEHLAGDYWQVLKDCWCPKDTCQPLPNSHIIRYTSRLPCFTRCLQKSAQRAASSVENHVFASPSNGPQAEKRAKGGGGAAEQFACMPERQCHKPPRYTNIGDIGAWGSGAPPLWRPPSPRRSRSLGLRGVVSRAVERSSGRVVARLGGGGGAAFCEPKGVETGGKGTTINEVDGSQNPLKEAEGHQTPGRAFCLGPGDVPLDSLEG